MSSFEIIDAEQDFLTSAIGTAPSMRPVIYGRNPFVAIITSPRNFLIAPRSDCGWIPSRSLLGKAGMSGN